VRRRRAGLDDDLDPLDVLTLDAAKQQADVLARAPLVEQLAEHLDAGDRGRLLLGWIPMMSTVSFTSGCRARCEPVTTVPRPVIVKTSSTGMRNGFSVSRTGSGTDSSTAAMSSRTFAPHSASPSSAFSAET